MVPEPERTSDIGDEHEPGAKWRKHVAGVRRGKKDAHRHGDDQRTKRRHDHEPTRVNRFAA